MSENLQDDPLTQSTLATVQRFNEAVNQHDIAMVMACMTEDCVFENTYPAPDGERYTGHEAVRNFWEKFFAASSQASFETEEMFACGDHCVVRWRYRWVEQDGKSGHIRGVDVLRVRDDKVAEKFSYVKG
jgi:ketosteroid isomerase-like protein